MKSAVAAFLSVLLGIGLGFAALMALSVSVQPYGRNPLPIMIFAALFLVVTGFIYARCFFMTVTACAAGLVAYAALVAVLIADLAGAGVDVLSIVFIADWLFKILAATLVPWFVGFAAGKFTRRIHLN